MNKSENGSWMDQTWIRKIDGEKFICTREDIIMLIIMHCWASAPEAIEFKTKLGFNQHDLIMTKEQSVSTKIMKAFSNEETLPQHSALSYKINLYFYEH